jgi:MoxR-like ATPase
MSELIVDVVGEIVRRKTKEKGSCSRDDLEEELQKLDQVAENRRNNGKIDFSNNRNWLSWKIIDARKDEAYIHVLDDRGNRVEAGESGKLPGTIDKMMFNEEGYDIEDPLVDLSDLSENVSYETDNSIYEQYRDFRTTDWSSGEDWKFEVLSKYQRKLENLDLSDLEESEVRDIIQFWDERRDGRIVPAFVMGQRFGGETWEEFSNRVSSSNKAADVVANLLDDDRDLEERLDLFYEEFGDIESASGGPLLTLATFFLGYTYPEKYVIYRHDYVIDPINQLFERADVSKNQGYNLKVYNQVREYSEIVLGKLDNLLDDTTYLDVWDLFYFYQTYWMPEEIKNELDNLYSRQQSTYGRLFALKCYLDMNSKSVTEEKLKNRIQEKYEEVDTSSNYEGSYTNLELHFVKNYNLFNKENGSIKPAEDVEDYLPKMKHYVNHLWERAENSFDDDFSQSFYWVKQGNRDEIEEEFLEASAEKSTHSHNLEKLNPGDKVIHYFMDDKEVIGYSEVIENAVEEEKEDENKLIVEIDLTMLDKPIPLGDIYPKLVENRGKLNKYYLLNENYGLNPGYLFEIPESLATFIIGRNNSLVDYVKEPSFEVQAPEELYFQEKQKLESKIEASLNSGKNIIFTGPPGTGKTKLAKSISEQVSEDEKVVEDSIFTTATADWTAFDTIGGYMPSKNDGEQLNFEEGQFLKCFRDTNGEVTNKWLVIDEINRSDIDKAFGQLFSVLSGDSVDLPYSRDETIEIRSVDDPDDNEINKIESNRDIFPVTDSWRLIATMNTLDKTSLYEMSYAFMRRFNFIHVDVPDLSNDDGLDTSFLEPREKLSAVWVDEEEINEETLNKEIDGELVYERLSVLWYQVNKTRVIGPSIVLDILKYLEARHPGQDALNDAVSSLVFPQMEGLTKDDLEQFFSNLDEKEEIDEDREISSGVETDSLVRKAESFFNRDLDI